MYLHVIPKKSIKTSETCHTRWIIIFNFQDKLKEKNDVYAQIYHMQNEQSYT